MVAATIAADVAVWLVDGVPARLVWNGVRYRVSDSPTPLTEEAWAPELTHAARRVVGWRFQGTTSGGHALIFDVIEVDAGTGWRLVHVYE
ncbi:hypothetical protein ACFSBZ_01850 [Amnibacterium flavum]|uniref:Uncharacterized protein n=1 Tax=Amnibacterium flavum TaxID=2173173 RepID=A0A2V1HQQ5_9MICO|nr:hypothetical protein [Amnibacterium flavum]PVZ94946.1 hypothetical protein DDQ50_13595 [Amnibacterium flavum]